MLNIENSMISSGEMVLMQTARVDINNPDNGFKQNTRMLLDSGSQRTYITVTGKEDETRNWRKRGNHAGNISEREEITLVTFRSETSKKIQTQTTILDIVLKDGSTLNIRANVVPQIAGSIQRRPVNLKSLKNWEHL